MYFPKVWKCPQTGQEHQVYDKLYTLDTWNEAQDEIMKQNRTDGCKLERVIASLMLWSDSMQLAQFGHASAWLIYLSFRNLSKYVQNTSERGSCQPIAFIPLVGDLPTVLSNNAAVSSWPSFTIATWVIVQVHIRPLKQKDPYWFAHPLQMQTHACHLKNLIGQCICGGI